jgi:hypothetical protein
LKKKNLGFKGNACQGRNCLCCDTEAPTLSRKTIKNLGKDSCKMPSKMISNEALKRKSKDKTAVGTARDKPNKAKDSNKKNPMKTSQKRREERTERGDEIVSFCVFFYSSGGYGYQ